MKFLFLNLESANKYTVENKICLINELVLDDDFNQISQKEILLNPMVDFDEYILKNLPYEKNKFDESKTFSAIYEELKEDFEQEDQVIIARNGYNDIKLLKQECNTNNLVPFTFKFYDFNEIYVATEKYLTQENFSTISKAQFTKDGKKNTELMAQIIKEISQKLEKTLRELLVYAVNSEGFFQDGFISFRRTKDVINHENNFNSNLNKNSNYKVFLRMLENVEKTTEDEPIFDGKNVSISANFETENFKEIVNLVLWLKNAGANYVTDASKCDIFIKQDNIVNGKVRKCNRFSKVDELKNSGKNIEVFSLEEILAKINKTKEDLFNADLPNLDFVYAENSKQAKPIKKYLKVRKNFGKV